MLVINVVERYFLLGSNKVPYTSERKSIYFIYTVYSSTYIHKLINETNTSPHNDLLLCCPSVDPFMRRAPIFVATSHKTRLTTLLQAASQQEGYLEQSEN